MAALDAYPEIKDTFVALTENHLLFSLDSLDMAGAVHGLRQMNITKYTIHVPICIGPKAYINYVVNSKI